MKPKHYKPQYAVAQTVADMTRRFIFPDTDTKPGPPFVSGGGGAPTIVVAASNASELSIAKADILAAGVNDHESIQAAIDRLPAPGTPPAFGGGRVLLTDGIFNVSPNEIDLSSRRATLQGMGASTRIRTTTNTGSVVGVGNFSVVRDIYFQGSSTEAAIGGTGSDIGVGTGGNGVLIDNCTFNGFDAAVYLSGNQWIIRGCRYDGNVPIFVTGHGQSFQSIIIAENVEVSDIVISSGTYWEIIGNNLLGGVLTNGAVHPSIVGNTIQASSPAPGADAMFELVATDSGLIVGNIMEANGWDGVYLNGSDNVLVDDNLLRGPDTGIEIEGDDNQIVGNKVISDGSDIGINVVSGNNNAVYANYLGDVTAYTTADFVDTATGTITAPDANGQFTY